MSLSAVLALAWVLSAAEPSSQPAAQTLRLSLEQTLQQAQEKFPLVNDAELQIRVQEAQKAQTFWAFFTPIEIIGMIGGPTPEARGNGRYLKTDASLQGDLNFGAPGFFAGYRAQGAIPLMTFGKLQSLRKVGALGVDIAVANRDRVRSEAQASALRAYFAHASAKSFLELVDESEKAITEAIKSATEVVEKNSDQVSDNDIFMLRTLLGQLLARRAEAEAGLGSAAELIRFLVQAPAEVAIDTQKHDSRVPGGKPTSVDRFLARAEDHRAELRMATRAVNLRKETLWIKKAALFPDVFVSGYFTQNYTSNQDYQTNPFLNNIANEWNGGLGLGARFTLDIPMKLAQIREAEAELQKAENQASLATGFVTLQVKKAWNDLKSTQVQAQNYGKAEKAAKSWVVSALLNFNSGLSPASDLFQAIRSYAESGALRRKSELDFALALAAMCEATGADFASIQSLAAGAKSDLSVDLTGGKP